MGKLYLPKKITVTLFVGMFMIVCVVLILLSNSKNIKESVTFEYNVKAGIVTFQVNQQYELTNIQLHYCDVKPPTYDIKTQTILFNIFDLKKGKSEFFTFQCTKKNDKQKASTNVTYEVIRGNDDVVIITYKNNIQVKYRSYYSTGT